MARALDLARRGEGMTRPNPPVGAVVVHEGQIIGEGYHHRAGGPHAEVLALNRAGEKARGATLYVTLEPCSTMGRTPACTDLIIQTGIATVVVAIRDPNPLHAGKGLRLLRRARVEVKEGVLKAEGERLIQPFAQWITEQRPFVTLKLAMTLDGKIADRRGKSKWITSEAARKEVQALRRRADAILVGASTVRADDPSLWPRPDRGRKPYRVVLDGTRGIPLTAKILTDEYARHTIIATTSALSFKLRSAYTRHGARVLPLAKQANIPLRALLGALARESVMHVLCEGGGAVAESLIRAELVDEYIFFVAPKIMGGNESTSAVSGKGWLMASLPALSILEHRLVGPDLMIRAVPIHDA